VNEKQLETILCEKLLAALTNRAVLNELSLEHSTSDHKTLGDLIGATPYEVIQDHSRWQQQPGFMTDVIGGMTPDIVLRSSLSGENRIYIEVKKDVGIGRGESHADSQMVRYFLHLLGTTHQRPPRTPTDIGRAVILAAPSSWFTASKNSGRWEYFLEKHTELASCFGITLAELHLIDD